MEITRIFKNNCLRASQVGLIELLTRVCVVVSKLLVRVLQCNHPQGVTGSEATRVPKRFCKEKDKALGFYLTRERYGLAFTCRILACSFHLSTFTFPVLILQKIGVFCFAGSGQ